MNNPDQMFWTRAIPFRVWVGAVLLSSGMAEPVSSPATGLPDPSRKPPGSTPADPSKSGAAAAAQAVSPDDPASGADGQDPSPAEAAPQPAESDKPKDVSKPEKTDQAPVDGVIPMVEPVSPSPDDPGVPGVSDSMVSPGVAGMDAVPEPDLPPLEDALSPEPGDPGSMGIDPVDPSQFGIAMPFVPNGRPALGSGEGGLSEMPGFNVPLVGNPFSDKGLTFTGFLTTFYDSNPTRGYDDPGFSGDVTGSDWITTAGVGVAYRSLAAATWTFNGQYNGGYTSYAEQNQFNAPYHQARASLNYDGSRLKGAVNSSFSMASGPSREYGEIADQSNFTIGGSASYPLGPKTSLASSLNYSYSGASGSVSDSRHQVAVDASGVWHYSPLTDFGAGLRCSLQTGDESGDRSAFGPVFSTGYRLSKLVQFRSQVGLEYATYDQGGGEFGVDASAGLNYSPSPLWSLSFDLRHGTQPQLGADSTFQTTSAARLGFRRAIERANLSAGLSYEFSSYDQRSGSMTPMQDRDYLAFDAAISRPVYFDLFYVTLFARYAEQQGAETESWDSIQVGLGVSHRF